ncbi:hypothetical protein D3C81_1369190 [compost metagenome]
MAGIERDADARGDAHFDLVELHRPRQFAEQAAGDFPGTLFGIGTGNQHRELIPAQARHAVAGTYALAQAMTDALQEEVAGIVAMGVVDRLEVIQVDQHESQGFALIVGKVQCQFCLFHQMAAIRQAGERIAVRGLMQLGLAFAQQLVAAGQLGGTLRHGVGQVAPGAAQQ